MKTPGYGFDGAFLPGDVFALGPVCEFLRELLNFLSITDLTIWLWLSLLWSDSSVLSEARRQISRWPCSLIMELKHE